MPPPGQVAVLTILTVSLLLLNNVSATEETYIASPLVTAQDFLLAHNEVRATYNAPVLTWDNKLAHYAHRWAEKTSALGKCEDRYHSNGPYGENLFWGWSWNDNFSPRDAVMMWADEKLDFDVKSLKCTPGKMCGHFTQIIWRNTQRVGCSRIKCVKGGVLMICNYDPPGNWIDSKLGGLMNPFASDHCKPLDVKTTLLPALPTVPLPSVGVLPGRKVGHHPGRAKWNRNRNLPLRHRNRHHLSPRQRYLNRIRRRQQANRKP